MLEEKPKGEKTWFFLWIPHHRENAPDFRRKTHRKPSRGVTQDGVNLRQNRIKAQANKPSRVSVK